MGLTGKTLFIFFYLIWLPNREVLHQCSDYTPAIDFVLSLFIFCCFASETVICLKSWKLKSNSIPMSGSVQLLNYFSVWIHRSPKMSALQTNHLSSILSCTLQQTWINSEWNPLTQRAFWGNLTVPTLCKFIYRLFILFISGHFLSFSSFSFNLVSLSMLLFLLLLFGSSLSARSFSADSI